MSHKKTGSDVGCLKPENEEIEEFVTHTILKIQCHLRAGLLESIDERDHILRELYTVRSVCNEPEIGRILRDVRSLYGED